VNRSTVGAIVRRQPFGGWKKSAVGAGAKAGGPNYLIGLSDWRPARATRGAALSPAASRLLSAAAGLAPDQREFLERAFASDALAWAEEFGVARDVSGLQVEQNVLRYLPVPVTVRTTNGDTAALLRVVGAGILAGAPVTVSSPEPLQRAVAEALRVMGVTYRVDDAAAWQKLLRDNAPARVRLLGGNRVEFARDSAGRVDIALYAQPVVEAGRIELLTFVREQAVAVTAHRFGSPTAVTQGLFES
jgi:RHH-type proline utilization regulon transcriptional repressor/proline dehydrogenase/delta 1-pyrroline-5-carboxylate dehydrogenase